jgi:hypothetical protein
LKYENMQDIVPFEAPDDIMDIWAWAKGNPDKAISSFHAERWTSWRTAQEALQERAAEVWAMVVDSQPAPTTEEALAGTAVFPSWFGYWWVEVLDVLVWSSRLEEAITEAEGWLSEPQTEVPSTED